MKICVVSDQAFPARGGEGVATQNLCTGLYKRGHEVLFITSKVPYPPRVEGVEVVRFPSVYIPQKGQFAIAFSSQIAPFLKKRRIQIIHINLPTFLGWQSLLAAKKLNIPRITGFHVQVGNVVAYNLPPFSFFKKLVELWFSHFYQMTDLLVSPSNLGKKVLSCYSSNQAEVVSNGIDFSIFNRDSLSLDDREKFREKFGLKNLSFLLYVGRLSKEKNVAYLLKIMQNLRKKNSNIKLLIAGKGELKNLLQTEALSTGLAKMVVFTGFLPQNELLCAYREADIFILPSLFELQGIVALEAMAMGCAILVARSSESAACEVVKEGVNGYTFDLKDPDDAVEKIHFILSRPGLKKSMQEASFRSAREHDIKTSILKMEKLYRQLMF